MASCALCKTSGALSAGGGRLRIAFEWPRNNDGWRQPVVQAITRLLPHSARPDGCMYGMLRQKPWRIATDFPLLVQTLARRCDRSHEHLRTRIGSTALYSRQFADAVARGLVFRPARPQGGRPARDARAGARSVYEAFPVEDGEASDDDMGVPPPPPPNLDEADGPTLRASVGRLHINLGHPSNAALARAIRLSGGSDAARYALGSNNL